MHQKYSGSVYLVALLSLRLVFRQVLVAGLIVHDEAVINEVEAVRLCLVRVRNHRFDFNFRTRNGHEGKGRME